MSQPRPLGFWTAVLCGFGILHVAAVFVFGATSTQWFQASIGDDLLWVRLAIAWTTMQLTLALLSLAVLQRAVRLPRGARGRARTVGLAITTGLHAVITTASDGRAFVGGARLGRTCPRRHHREPALRPDPPRVLRPRPRMGADALSHRNHAPGRHRRADRVLEHVLLVPGARRASRTLLVGLRRGARAGISRGQRSVPALARRRGRREPGSRGRPRECHDRVWDPALPARGGPPPVGLRTNRFPLDGRRTPPSCQEDRLPRRKRHLVDPGRRGLLMHVDLGAQRDGRLSGRPEKEDPRQSRAHRRRPGLPRARRLATPAPTDTRDRGCRRRHALSSSGSHGVEPLEPRRGDPARHRSTKRSRRSPTSPAT